MYYYVVTSERDWLGPYSTSGKAEEVKDNLDLSAEVFASQYSNLSKAKQEYREKHPEWQHKNFKKVPNEVL